MKECSREDREPLVGAHHAPSNQESSGKGIRPGGREIRVEEEEGGGGGGGEKKRRNEYCSR